MRFTLFGIKKWKNITSFHGLAYNIHNTVIYDKDRIHNHAYFKKHYKIHSLICSTSIYWELFEDTVRKTVLIREVKIQREFLEIQITQNPTK